ncbi:MAG: translesion error-prone DNA polymerase V autoproteolytic subunit [Proteobacteria bacterium]|nr:translesion error-prone DNA polymerase V autoproteolytic subunit [Pseudomonadota bacterium]MBU1710359.1 translesion error-prone DNA polymerase V autoproteolytic subunit [Pseudomonadota bacterium]
MQIKESSVTAIYSFDPKTRVMRPLFSTGVSAGFPSPAEDYIDRHLDLNERLIDNPAATFFVRVAGDSMIGAGINHDDIVIVDRSLEPASGRIVIAVLNGELAVKRLVIQGDSCRLVSENPEYPPLEISPETPLEIWGVATYAIHKL